MDQFGGVPAMRIDDRSATGPARVIWQEQPNVLRLLVGDSDDSSGDAGWQEDQVWILETNLDDVPGEWIAYCSAASAGRGRVGRVPDSHPDEEEPAGGDLERDVPGGRHDGSNGSSSPKQARWASAAGSRTDTRCRVRPCEVETAWGRVAGKLATLADGTTSFAPEYESCRQLAAATGRPLRDIYRAAQQAFELSLPTAGQHNPNESAAVVQLVCRASLRSAKSPVGLVRMCSTCAM